LYADALTGVYATDPKYGSKLRSIMSKHLIDRGTEVAANDQDPKNARATRCQFLKRASRNALWSKGQFRRSDRALYDVGAAGIINQHFY
jgi:hypothetical protein